MRHARWLGLLGAVATGASAGDAAIEKKVLQGLAASVPGGVELRLAPTACNADDVPEQTVTSAARDVGVTESFGSW